MHTGPQDAAAAAAAVGPPTGGPSGPPNLARSGLPTSGPPAVAAGKVSVIPFAGWMP